MNAGDWTQQHRAAQRQAREESRSMVRTVLAAIQTAALIVIAVLVGIQEHRARDAERRAREGFRDLGAVQQQAAAEMLRAIEGLK